MMKYEIYCDESRQDLIASSKSITDNNKYCCIGGLMIPSDKRDDLKQKIKRLKAKHGVYGELKWGTVSNSKLSFYIDLINIFFDNDYIKFRTVVIDAQKIDNKNFNNNSQELGYYKFYYQLLTHWVIDKNTYYVFTDQKTNNNKYRLHDLHCILNNSFYHASPIVDIQAIDSKESIIMQFQNVIMGAVGYKYNFHNNYSSEPKKIIVKTIENRLGRPIGKTGCFEYKFNIFVIDLRENN